MVYLLFVDWRHDNGYTWEVQVRGLADVGLGRRAILLELARRANAVQKV